MFGKRKISRKELIDNLIRDGYLSKSEVINAMLKVPRHKFVPENQEKNAYVDSPLHIGNEQTISAPHMVAMMTEHLDVKTDHKILEIGSGSGYQAAVLAEIAKSGEIYSVERIPDLARNAEKNLLEAGYKNVSVIIGEGTMCHSIKAPYDRIIVTAGAPKIPLPLIDQLKDNGKMLIPVGSRMYQELILIEKKEGGGEITKTNLGGCMFVPLIGEGGW